MTPIVRVSGTDLAVLVRGRGSMLRITEQRAPGRVVLKLEGRVAGDWVREVDACWHAALESNSNASILVDLTDVDRVDVAGQGLLARMYRAGARFITRGCQMRELVREISEL